MQAGAEPCSSQVEGRLGGGGGTDRGGFLTMGPTSPFSPFSPGGPGMPWGSRGYPGGSEAPRGRAEGAPSRVPPPLLTCRPGGPPRPRCPRAPSSPFCPNMPCCPRRPGSPSAPCHRRGGVSSACPIETPKCGAGGGQATGSLVEGGVQGARQLLTAGPGCPTGPWIPVGPGGPCGTAAAAQGQGSPECAPPAPHRAPPPVLTASPLSPLLPFWPGSPISPCPEGKTG